MDKLKVVDSFIRKNGGAIIALMYRWENEKEHANIKEYEAATQRMAGQDLLVVKMLKGPLGFVAQIGESSSFLEAKVRNRQGKIAEISYKIVKNE
jgi:hypothetical protein